MEKKIKLLVIDDNQTITDSIKMHFCSNSSIEVSKVFNNGKEGLWSILNETNSYDMVIMDLILPDVDGLEILEEMKNNNISKKVVILSSYKKEYAVAKTAEYGVSYYMLKPFSMNSLEKRIIEVYANNSTVINNQNDNVMLAISNMLHSLGMPSHIKGYQYIRESILMMYDNPDMLGGITKEIYPEIADKYNTTSSRVERAIRHAIEVSWNRGDYDLMEEIFGNSVDYDRAKPTNSEFIVTIADKLRIDKTKVSI